MKSKKFVYTKRNQWGNSKKDTIQEIEIQTENLLCKCDFKFSSYLQTIVLIQNMIDLKINEYYQSFNDYQSSNWIGHISYKPKTL